MAEPILPSGLAPWVTLLLFRVTSLLVTASALIERSGPIRLRHWAEKTGGRVLTLYLERHRFEAFRFLLSLFARLMPLAFLWASWELLKAYGLPGAILWAPVVVLVLLALVEWLNRYLVEHHSEGALRVSTRFLSFLAFVFSPLVWLLSPFVALSDEEEDEDDASDDEIEAFIDVGLREGILEPKEQELVRSIVDFGDTQVRSVMTPRVEIVSASVAAGPEEIAHRFFESKHARLPLYHESIDHIVGILHIRDLFEAMHRGKKPFSAEEIANTPLYVPEAKTLPELLTEMQALHQQMAIVVDEYGGVAGLVTVEDLVEEIVGEIADEHESQEAPPLALGDGRYRLQGRTYLEDLEDLLGFDADKLPYETISGLICGELGYVPSAGETVAVHGLSFNVEEADERRVMAVKVEGQSSEESAESD